MTYHVIHTTPSGAECSCGRKFSAYKAQHRTGYRNAQWIERTTNLVRAGARRHAEAANRKEKETK